MTNWIKVVSSDIVLEDKVLVSRRLDDKIHSLSLGLEEKSYLCHLFKLKSTISDNV